MQSQRIPIIGILGMKYKDKYIVSKPLVDWLAKEPCHLIYLYPKMTKFEFVSAMKQVDGIVFPGGWEHPFPENKTYRFAKKIIEVAISMGPIPIMGICLGMQYLVTYFSGKQWKDIHTVVNASCTPNILHLEPWVTLPFHTKTHYCFNHKYAFSTEMFRSNSNLQTFFDILTTSTHKGIHFVSTIQGKTLPIFGTQWHPEQPGHNCSPNQHIPRSMEAIKTGEIIAHQFVSLCLSIRKKTISKPTDAFLNKYTIYERELVQNENPETMEWDDIYEYYVLCSIE